MQHWHPLIVSSLDEEPVTAALFKPEPSRDEARASLVSIIEEMRDEQAAAQTCTHPHGRIFDLAIELVRQDSPPGRYLLGTTAIGIVDCEGTSEKACNSAVDEHAEQAMQAYADQMFLLSILKNARGGDPTDRLIADLTTDTPPTQDNAMTGFYM